MSPPLAPSDFEVLLGDGLPRHRVERLTLSEDPCALAGWTTDQALLGIAFEIDQVPAPRSAPAF
jgi:hypothetical protein